MNTKEYLIKLTKPRKRVGRGIGSGRGKTSGWGQKGQKARKSGLPRPGFEGGQTPINRRIPKQGFFHPKKKFHLINLTQLEKDKKKFDNQVIDYSQNKKPVKILGDGELTENLENWTIRATAFTKSVQKKIEQAGGKIEVVSKYEKPKE